MFDFAAVPYSAGELVAAALAALVLVLVWRRRSSPGATGLAITLGLCVWWCIWHALSLLAATLPLKLGLADVWEAGAISVNSSYLLFAIEYHSQRRLPRRQAALLFIPAAVFVGLFWTNGWHHLFWAQTSLVAGVPFTRIGIVYGPLAWAFAAYSSSYLATVSVLLLRVAAAHRGLYRRQVALIILGFLGPWASYLLFFSGIQIVPHYDLTTLLLTADVSCVAWALYGQKLLDVVPVAHRLVVEGIADVVVVLDDADRIVHANPAARAFAGDGRTELLGRPLAEALPELARALADGRPELVCGVGRDQRRYDIRVSPLNSAASGRGRVLVVRDETDRYRIDDLQRSRRHIIAAEENVRRHIAEMLHGPVQSKLLSAWIRLGQCQERWGELLGPEAREIMAGVRDDLDVIREQDIRRASHLLHPAGLRIGLLPAVDYLAGGYEDFFSVDVTATEALRRRDALGRQGLGEELRLVIYRVVEEALNNAAKHACARQVDVRLDFDGMDCLVTVQDDGAGFDRTRVTPGFGFCSIVSRVEECLGTWDVEAAPGTGTKVTVRLPARSAEQAAEPLPVRYTDAVSRA
ncbi:MAG TPA: histidine kinase N-terminal 7TM domain-containing protein [Chloroflexota bacterium]|nr:histidine kinase N-terminal 7TM domain-containing protein [Chloroflexota bacterium]